MGTAAQACVCDASCIMAGPDGWGPLRASDAPAAGALDVVVAATRCIGANGGGPLKGKGGGAANAAK